ncbi:NAD-dependent epimerase/dehydratase family protein [Effusibacillus pohliae]|uniref:NAD-dependent epimerase/dehydratase family protein n=1 Tax=Effusibacillus pohliae TaxID=232270 RepID=UPI00035EDDCB|nr:NAD-dependent epimerase/dehydratase family protein [Effusibacillus pohliae]
MKIIVTGAAGFIGSHLTERLLAEGHRVIGIDMFHQPQWNRFKRFNLAGALQHPNFTLIEGDLLQLDLAKIVADDTDVVFHQAAIAGVRNSWGANFQAYVELNILATQRLLEACKDRGIKKFVYASSSSVYGGTNGPTPEDTPPQPISPYGVSKLAGEHLVRMYHLEYGLPTTSLRYFTVYGPRQRPDMAFHKFLKAVLQGQPIPVYGNGQQTRDFTYVTDVVEANVQAMNWQEHGNVFNIGGAERASVLEVLDVIREVTGRQVEIEWLPRQSGDPLCTWADISLVSRKLGYHPQVTLRQGLAKEWEYIREIYAAAQT